MSKVDGPSTNHDPLDTYLSSLVEFQSEDRIESLYSDFSSARQSNPTGFEANISTWKKLLNDILRLGLQNRMAMTSNPEERDEQLTPDRLILHLNDQLLDRLRRPRIGKPYGLFCPIWYLSSLSPSSKNPVLSPLSRFINSQGWSDSTGLTSTMFNSLSWVSRTFIGGSYFDPDQRFEQLDLEQKWKLVKIDWVNLSLLYEAADTIVERYLNKFVGLTPLLNCLFTLTQFKTELTQDVFPTFGGGSSYMSNGDINLLIKHLERDRRVLVCEDQIIKFVLPRTIETHPSGRMISKTSPSPINDTDRGVLSVKQTISQLKQQIQTIERQIEKRTEEAQKHLQKSQKELAASQLRSRKLLRDVLHRRFGTLETLQTVYFKIEQASTDSEIMAAYQTSTKTLQNLLSSPNLSLENIEASMDKLHEVLADQKDIDDAIDMSNALNGNVSIDENELATELRSLVEEPDSTVLVDDLESRMKGLTVPDVKINSAESNSSVEFTNGERVALES
ncbi:Snf7-domain-containing protein [Phakopsora pachyrhizi]|uniref:Snf7-domain-containing protein n=1 Tax=Phakopsora pachyrhizi TaxID=170000 RepID=A0AAV0B982_PHAPC|nr:Snf7-domain-containing protein [Phakopsora pachyrhizi]CAH7683095.1 Snf7-domain-containing protein [Phakopsora pachyrhizi]